METAKYDFTEEPTTLEYRRKSARVSDLLPKAKQNSEICFLTSVQWTDILRVTARSLLLKPAIRTSWYTANLLGCITDSCYIVKMSSHNWKDSLNSLTSIISGKNPADWFLDDEMMFFHTRRERSFWKQSIQSFSSTVSYVWHPTMKSHFVQIRCFYVCKRYTQSKLLPNGTKAACGSWSTTPKARFL